MSECMFMKCMEARQSSVIALTMLLSYLTSYSQHSIIFLNVSQDCFIFVTTPYFTSIEQIEPISSVWESLKV